MDVRYEYRNMLRARIGGDGISSEEVQALAGRLEVARQALRDRKRDGRLGFSDVPRQRPNEDAMKVLVRTLVKDVDTLVVIGIGGSLLGAQAVHAALEGLAPKRRAAQTLDIVFVGDATDPQSFIDLCRRVDWKRAAINVISKSGDTIEPMSMFTLARQELLKAVGPAKAARRIIATTDVERGTLKLIADREGYATLPVPDNVGGRFSVLTEVGAFPLMAAGVDLGALWKGAAEADAAFWKEGVLKNSAALYAGLQFLFYRRGKPISVLMPYAKRLALIGAWYRQLWAESLGKKSDRHRNRVHAGPTPIAAVGPADQHSQIQLYNEGPFDKVVTFVEVESYAEDVRLPEPWPDIEGVSYFAGHTLGEIVRIEREATAEALADNRRPNAAFFLASLSAKPLGALLQTLMLATALAGELFDVDAFDQPGVEAGKRNMYRLMGRAGY